MMKLGSNDFFFSFLFVIAYTQFNMGIDKSMKRKSSTLASRCWEKNFQLWVVFSNNFFSFFSSIDVITNWFRIKWNLAQRKYSFHSLNIMPITTFLSKAVDHTSEIAYWTRSLTSMKHNEHIKLKIHFVFPWHEQILTFF